MNAAVVRFFVAIDNDVVVRCRPTLRNYRWAVQHTGKSVWFLTWHSTLDGATHAMTCWESTAPDKQLLEVVEATRRYVPGEVFQHEDERFEAEDSDESIDEHARREVEILESCWRNS